MSIKEIVKLAKLETGTLFKMLYILFFVFFAFAPGCALLVLEGKIELFNSQLIIALGLSLLISAPFIFLGSVVYLHPYQTLLECLQQSATEVAWSLLIGIGMWSLISAGATFSFIRTANEWLVMNVSEETYMQYGAVWFLLLSVFWSIFYFNLSRKVKS